MREPSVIKQKIPQQTDSTIDRIINISDHVIGIEKKMSNLVKHIPHSIDIIKE